MIQDAIDKLARALGTDYDRIVSRGREQWLSDRRTVVIYCLYQSGWWNNPEIGRAMDRSHSCVNEARKRVEAWMEFPKSYQQQLSLLRTASGINLNNR